LLQDMLGSSIGIIKDLIVPQPHDTPPQAFQKCGTPRVVSSGLGMLTTI